MVLFALFYFILNSSLIASVIAFQKKLNPWEVWRGGFLWLSLNYFCGASVAILLVGYTRSIDVRFVGVVVPLLLVLYYTFKTSMQRVEDANKHVDALNALYLSTIETLAMAIDAKDQVTHGHIRRVQSYAIGLAREVGIREENLLRAIEAAALLHDMGKLAVPEYILNKPGKLTESEFDKMKLHASVGADILSAIAFPYPVVPIVRHHHENWDGSGYPTGLRGTEIPIGARILSVVDCFDALTSDRPYRPRLSDDEAIRILTERRGSMYDPLVVDTFVRVHHALEPEPIISGPPPRLLNEIASARQSNHRHGEHTRAEEACSNADEILVLYELLQALAGQVGLKHAADMISRNLRRLVPASLTILFIYDRNSGEIEARYAVGEGATLVQGLTIALGQRLSGWVAANQQTISNSSAILDLGEAARTSSHTLTNCLSTPLVCDNQLVGVLSLYSSEKTTFNDDHRRVIEALAPQIANTVQGAIEFDASCRRDELTGLPSLGQLQRILGAKLTAQNDDMGTGVFLVIEVSGFHELKISYGHSIVDEILKHVVQRTQSALRVADILFRATGSQFVAFLGAPDRKTAESVAENIRRNVSAVSLSIGGSAIFLQVQVTTLLLPKDVDSLRELVSLNRSPSLGLPKSAKSLVH